MKYFVGAILFMGIGTMPTILGGYSLDAWQWWATIVPLNMAIVIYDNLK